MPHDDTAEEDEPADPTAKDLGRRMGITVYSLYDEMERRGGPEWNPDESKADLAQRPDQALRKGKRFKPLREEPWKIELAVLMAWFARSNDTSPDGGWPYERFQDRLENGGYFLPDGVSIAEAVDIVAAEIARLAPATKTKAPWYDVNIATPMARRHVTPNLGTASTDEDREPRWLAGSTRDLDLDHTVITLADIHAAPDLLRRWLTDCETKIAGSTAAVGPLGQQDSLQELAWRAKALRTALRLAEEIASSVKDPDSLHLWARRTNETQEDLQASTHRWSSATSQLVISAATDAGQVEVDSPEFASHCREVGAMYGRAIAMSKDAANANNGAVAHE